MKVTAQLNKIRIAPRKTKLVADLIKGMDVTEALNQLDSTVKRTSPLMKKLLQSAVANGENNFGLDKNNLFVCDVVIGAGPTLKRWMPKAFGRAGQILKRTSRITIVLDERVEGKGRKTKEQLEEARKKRAKETKSPVEEKKETKKAATGTKKSSEESKKGADKKGWANKLFHRKSM